MLNIISAGIDHSIASIEQREKFALTKSKQAKFYEFLKSKPDILGSAIVSTCNRTELYLSLKENSKENPFNLILEFLKIEEELAIPHKIYIANEVIDHLSLLSCGAESQIFGEDQIITQIKSSITLSRERGATDPIIEVLFRTCISCGKKIKSTLPLSRREISIADIVLEKMKKHGEIKRVLVIGNGEIGRHMAKKLVENGYMATMSVREYLHAKVQLPNGCKGVDFSLIYQEMENCEAVVSATLSPHHTVKTDSFSKLKKHPKYLFDLAIPRDIQPSVSAIEDVKIWDVDTLSCGVESQEREQLQKDMKILIEKYKQDFHKWYQFKRKMATNKDI